MRQTTHKSKRRNRGFIIFFGWRTVISSDGSAPVQAECPSCRTQTHLQGKQHRRWFTLFFIPVIPLSSPTRFTECPRCHAQFRLDTDAMRKSIAAQEQSQRQEAITLHNSLINAPKNSVALNQLMCLHAGLREFDTAIAEAAQFPDALNSSEQCMTTLARVYLCKNDHANALAWFDAAIARNPDLAEPHYHRALALLNQPKPDAEQALAEARKAKSLGHPEAEGLLKHVETKARQIAATPTAAPALT